MGDFGLLFLFCQLKVTICDPEYRIGEGLWLCEAPSPIRHSVPSAKMCGAIQRNTFCTSIWNLQYNNASLWLCSRYQIVHPNIRDVFSAGGRITTADGVELMRPVSKIYRTIVSSAPMIKHILSCPDDDLVKQISEFNPKLLSDGLDLYDNWVEMCDMIARNDNVSQLRYWIENNSVLE